MLPSENHTERLYQAALYARRKFSDVVQPDEPDPTATAQIKELKTFLADLSDIQISGIYMDSRRLKQESPRPEFYRLMAEIQNGRYDCIVVSSFELFGKDHIENRYYLLNLLAMMKIRIISVHDNYDSLHSEPVPGAYKKLEELIIMVDKYARSRSIAATARQKKANSFLELTFTPFGYLYNPDTPSNLDIDPVTAPYVQYIFKEFLSGTKRSYIAKQLTQMGVPSPSLRKKQLGITYTKPDAKDYWTFGSVNYILKNRAYTGDLVYGQQRSAMYVFHECRKRHWTGETQIIENHHEPLVSRQDFERTQTMLELLFEENRSNAGKRPGTLLPPTPFRNVVRCGHCGRSMYIVRHMSNRHPYSAYICSSHRMKLPDACPKQSFRLDEIIPRVKEAIEQERKLAISIAEQMKDGEQSTCYLQIEQYYQDKINDVLEQFKTNTEHFSVLETSQNPDGSFTHNSVKERSDQLREELTKILDAKQQFRKDFNLENPWLVLFTQVPENFEITKEWSQKLIFQINLFRDAPLTVTCQEAKSKELLLFYFSLIKNGTAVGKENHYGTKEPPERTNSTNQEL